MPGFIAEIINIWNPSRRLISGWNSVTVSALSLPGFLCRTQSLEHPSAAHLWFVFGHYWSALSLPDSHCQTQCFNLILFGDNFVVLLMSGCPVSSTGQSACSTLWLDQVQVGNPFQLVAMLPSSPQVSNDSCNDDDHHGRMSSSLNRSRARPSFMAATPVDALKAISSEIKEQRSEQVTFTSVFVETSQVLAGWDAKRGYSPETQPLLSPVLPSRVAYSRTSVCSEEISQH